MYKATILLENLEKAREFVQICSAQEFNIELSAGEKVVHAKSIIGVLSMNLAEKMELSVAKGDAQAIERFAQKLSPFLAD